MLASQRTRLLQRGHAQNAAFDPAEILPDGAAVPIAAVMGPFKRLGQALNPGGFLPDLELAFRVLRASFAAAPILGMTLQWRVPGETPYRGTLRVERILDRTSSPYIVLGCINPHK